MHKRIEELKRQATETFKYSDSDGDNNRGVRLNEDKFAELIVIECANICYQSPFKDGDAHAQNILFTFNIDNCRNDK